MTVEEQLLLNTMTAECTRLHKAIENIKADIAKIDDIQSCKQAKSDYKTREDMVCSWAISATCWQINTIIQRRMNGEDTSDMIN